MKKNINGKIYNTATSTVLDSWDNVSTNVGKTSTPWGVQAWCLHLGQRSPNHGYVNFDLCETEEKDLFIVISAGWEEKISKIETKESMSEAEWAMRINFFEDGYTSKQYSDIKKSSLYETIWGTDTYTDEEREEGCKFTQEVNAALYAEAMENDGIFTDEETINANIDAEMAMESRAQENWDKK